MMLPIIMLVTLNTAAVQLPNNEIQELCVVTVGSTGAKTYVASCSDILTSVNDEVKRGYPGQLYELVLNGKSLNTI